MHKIIVFLSLTVLSYSAYAEVFKCRNTLGKIIYQPEPCAPGVATQGVINVKKMTLEADEMAKAKLKAWQEQQAIEAAAKKEAEREKQAQLEKQESLALQRRSVIAQEKQAIAAQQQQQNNRPIVIPAWDFNRFNRHNTYRDRWRESSYPQHPYYDRQTRQLNRIPPANQTYKDPPPPPFRSPEITGKQNP